MEIEERKFSIVIWETEEDRDKGESFIAETFKTEIEAVDRAKKLFYRMDCAAIEVLNEVEECVFGLYEEDDEDDD